MPSRSGRTNCIYSLESHEIPKGEVFVMFPRTDKQWDSHASIHADGTHHQKSFGYKFGVQGGEKPNESFQETRNVVTTGVACGEARAINIECDASEFSDIFEIPSGTLRPEKYRTYLSVGLTSRCATRSSLPAHVFSNRALSERCSHGLSSRYSKYRKSFGGNQLKCEGSLMRNHRNHGIMRRLQLSFIDFSCASISTRSFLISRRTRA